MQEQHPEPQAISASIPSFLPVPSPAHTSLSHSPSASDPPASSIERSFSDSTQSTTTSYSMAYSSIKQNPATANNALPQLPLDLRQHKLAIAIPWIIIVLTSGVLPILGYFALHYGVPSLTLKIVLSPWLGLMGAASLFNLGKRTWLLVKSNSTCRPLGQQSGWGLDFFGWNFLLGFIALTALIAAGISTEILEIVCLPLSVLLLYVCLELVFVFVGTTLGMRAPFRCSSVAKGDVLRPGCYVIVEDVVAVDGEQGQAFRRAWRDRYEASPVMRSFLTQMDLIWGVSGLCVVAVIWGVALGVHNKEIGYAIGWALPWLWGGAMTLLTIAMSKSMLRKEKAQLGLEMSA